MAVHKVTEPNNVAAQMMRNANAVNNPKNRLKTHTLVILMTVYMMNHLDRQIVNILAEYIKADLHLSDKQLGLITGLSFALLYTTLGIPLARLSERLNRVKIIAGSLFVWSGFTMACGFAQSLPGLFVARIGVGMGEAGCLPAAHSMIAEYTPPNYRGRAISIFMVGSPLGVLLGMALGGIVNDHYGWRMSFILAGIPGILLTLVLLALLKDPVRSNSSSLPPPSLKATWNELMQNPSFWFLTGGASLGALVTYAQGAFIASFFLRNHNAALTSLSSSMGPGAVIGIMLGLILGAGGAIGMMSGGILGDRLGRGNVRGYMTVAAASSVLVIPPFLGVLIAENFWLAMCLLVPAGILNTFWPGPVYASIPSLVHVQSRATAAAISLFFTTLVGLGLGPFLIGTLSDFLGASMGSAEGLRWALALSTLGSLSSALMFFLARRSSLANCAQSAGTHALFDQTINE